MLNQNFMLFSYEHETIFDDFLNGHMEATSAALQHTQKSEKSPPRRENFSTKFVIFVKKFHANKYLNYSLIVYKECK